MKAYLIAENYKGKKFELFLKFVQQDEEKPLIKY